MKSSPTKAIDPSKPLPNPRHEQFAQNICDHAGRTNYTRERALIDAGYTVYL